MTPLYFLIITIITPAGELRMDATPVPNCEGKVEFQQLMESRVKVGDIKDWNALCLTVGDKSKVL